MNIRSLIATPSDTPVKNIAERKAMYACFDQDEENLEFDVESTRHDPNAGLEDEEEVTRPVQEKDAFLVDKENFRPQSATTKSKKTVERRPAESLVLGEVPDFIPLTHDKPELSSPVLSLPGGVDISSPITIFSLFFSNEMLNTIVSNTNKYAEKKRKEQNKDTGRPWTEVTLDELKIWIAHVIYQGVHKEPELKLYWNRQIDLPYHRISRTMTQMRFEQIKRYIHISEPSNSERVAYYKKTEPLLSHFRETSKELYTPRTNVSIDEMIVKFKGRSKDTCRMKLKPIPEGYNIYALCDAGYTYTFHPDTPQESMKVDPVTGFAKTSQIVGTLLCGAILIEGNKALLVNGVEIYSRYRTLDAHHEHFSGNFSENSLPTHNNRYDADIRLTNIGGKLMIGTKTMDALVVSSIRIDTDLIPPEVGPFTKHFIPSHQTSVFLSNKSIAKSNQILDDKMYRIQPQQEFLSNLKQVESKFDKQSTHNICRFHYMHTNDLTTQPYTLYTFADSDTTSESDSILGSQLFQSVALGVYCSNQLKRSSITRLIEHETKNTSVVKSMKKMLSLFEVDELEIVGNTELNTILKEIASVIVTNGLKGANEKTPYISQHHKTM